MRKSDKELLDSLQEELDNLKAEIKASKDVDGDKVLRALQIDGKIRIIKSAYPEKNAPGRRRAIISDKP